MQIVVAFIILGLAVVGLVFYMCKAFQKGDVCSKCAAGKSSCGGELKQGKCC